MMKTLAPLTLAAAVALPFMAQAQDASTVVATVGGSDITVGHMIAMRERLPEQYQSLPDDTLFEGIIEQLIQQEAVGADAGGLSTGGELIIENERRALLATEVITRLSEEAVTDEAVQAAYDEQFGSAEPGVEYNAAHILVETEEEANTLITELTDGGADFAALAREHSTGPSGPSGGDLGWFGPGAMVGPFDQAVQEMEVGAVAGPVQTQFGWHVIKLNETRDLSVPPLEEVRGQIIDQLQSSAVEEIINERMSAVEIERTEAEIDPSVIRDTSLLD